MSKKGATQSGGGAGRSKEKNVRMAAMMKKNPGRYPDSVMKPHNGVGSGDRKAAASMGAAWKGRYSSTYERGMLGGVLAERLGYGPSGI